MIGSYEQLIRDLLGDIDCTLVSAGEGQYMIGDSAGIPITSAMDLEAIEEWLQNPDDELTNMIEDEEGEEE